VASNDHIFPQPPRNEKRRTNDDSVSLPLSIRLINASRYARGGSPTDYYQLDGIYKSDSDLSRKKFPIGSLKFSLPFPVLNIPNDSFVVALQ